MGHNHQDEWEVITCFSKPAKAFGLKINLKKTKVMYQSPLGSHDIGQGIHIESHVLMQVNQLKYQGSTDSNSYNLYIQINRERRKTH